MKRGNRYYVPLATAPWFLTATRLGLAPALWWSIARGEAAAALGILAVACLTDALDGWLARRQGVASDAGMYFDATADFVVGMAGLAALHYTGIYPAWCLAVVAGMFAQFVATSLWGHLRYDPLGRYYGGFLYGLMGFSLLAPELASAVGGAALALVTAACVVSRVLTGVRTVRICAPRDRLPGRRETGALVSRSS